MKKTIKSVAILLFLLAAFSGCTRGTKQGDREPAFEFRLASRSAPIYKWEMEQEGQGAVDIKKDRERDPDVRYWEVYQLFGSEPGSLTIIMKYTDGKEVMYTMTYDLTINEDGSITVNSVDGDVDEATTT